MPKHAQPEGYLPVKDYATKYGLTASMVYIRVHMMLVDYIRVKRSKALFILDKAPQAVKRG